MCIFLPKYQKKLFGFKLHSFASKMFCMVENRDIYILYSEWVLKFELISGACYWALPMVLIHVNQHAKNIRSHAIFWIFQNFPDLPDFVRNFPEFPGSAGPGVFLGSARTHRYPKLGHTCLPSWNSPLPLVKCNIDSRLSKFNDKKIKSLMKY